MNCKLHPRMRDTLTLLILLMKTMLLCSPKLVIPGTLSTLAPIAPTSTSTTLLLDKLKQMVTETTAAIVSTPGIPTGLSRLVTDPTMNTMLNVAIAVMHTLEIGGMKSSSHGDNSSETTFSALMTLNKMTPTMTLPTTILLLTLTTATPLILQNASGVTSSLFLSRTRAHAVPATLSPPLRSLRVTTPSLATVSSLSLSSRLLTVDTVITMVATVDGPLLSLTLLLLLNMPSGLRRTTNMLLELNPASQNLQQLESKPVEAVNVLNQILLLL